MQPNADTELKKLNDNPAKSRVNLVEADDIIMKVIFQVNIVTNVSDWVIDSDATRHICANKTVFVSYTHVNEGKKIVYLGNSTTTLILEKERFFSNLHLKKNVGITGVLHVLNI